MKKKEFELFVIDNYLRASQKQNIYSYSQLDNDPPDFLLNKGKQNIGCEVTEFFNDYDEKGAISKRSESIYADIHNKIRQKLLVEIPIGYFFTINYKPKILVHVNKEEESDKVIQILRNNLDNKFIKGISDSVNDITIKKISNRKTLAIRSAGQRFVEPTEKIVENIIKSKIDDLVNWPSDIKEKWLLIHFGKSDPNIYSVKDFKRLKKVEYYGFDKIVLFDIAFKEYLVFDDQRFIH